MSFKAWTSYIVIVKTKSVANMLNRAQAFFYIASTSLITEVLAPPVGSILMSTWDAYAPLLCGFPFEAVALLILLKLPSTLHLVEQRPNIAEVLPENEDEESNTEDIRQDHQEDSVSKSKAFNSRLRNALEPLIEVWTLVSGNRDVLLVAISFLVTTLGREILDFLVQYTSKRFGWSLADVRFL